MSAGALMWNLKFVGASLLFLAFAHFFFPRRFGWRADFEKISLVNSEIFRVHYYFIVLILTLFGALTLFFTDLLLRPDPLSRVVLTGFVIFWLARLFAQLFIFNAKLWRGNPTNTAIHFALILVWSYFTASYALALGLHDAR